MANVIVCYYSDCESIYQSIAAQLKEMGNNVYLLNIFGYIDFDNWGGNYELREGVLHFLEGLNPDLVLDFNHSLPPELEEQIACPICLWDADNPKHWWNKETILKNIDHYHFLGFKSCDKELYEEFFTSKIEKYLHLPVATAMQSENQQIKHNISFIGSTFLDLERLALCLNIFQKAEGNFHLFQEMFGAIEKNYFVDPDELYGKLKQKTQFKDLSKDFFQNVFTDLHWSIMPGCERLQHLSVISDLGLSIYGNIIWPHMMAIYPDVTSCFNPTRVKTVKENQDVYNSSKIAINLSHPQAKDYYSWRVLDIMASNACLLTEDKKDFRELFSQYLPKDVIEAIIFKDKFELRQKAIELLNNEELRLKCVKECQSAIEKCGRWEDKIKKIAEFTGVNLCDSKNKKAKIKFVFPDIIDLVKQKESKGKRQLSNAQINRKLMFYPFMLFLSCLPIIKCFFNDRNRKNYALKIVKYQEEING